MGAGIGRQARSSRHGPAARHAARPRHRARPRCRHDAGSGERRRARCCRRPGRWRAAPLDRRGPPRPGFRRASLPAVRQRRRTVARSAPARDRRRCAPPTRYPARAARTRGRRSPRRRSAARSRAGWLRRRFSRLLTLPAHPPSRFALRWTSPARPAHPRPARARSCSADIPRSLRRAQSSASG